LQLWHPLPAESFALTQSSAIRSLEWPKGGTTRWVNWADALANRLDPFTNDYFKRAVKWEELDPELDCEPDE